MQDIELVVRAQLVLPHRRREEHLFDMRAAEPLGEHIGNLHGVFGGVELLQAEAADLALWIPMHARWLTAEEWARGDAHSRFWITEGCTLQLRLSPESDAAKTLSTLMAGDDNTSAALCAELPARLIDAHFGAAFTELGGVEGLLDLATTKGDAAASPVEDHVADPTGARKALDECPVLVKHRMAAALDALASALAFPAAAERLLAADGVTRLVRLTYDCEPGDVDVEPLIESALGSLSILCARANGFVLVHGATVRVAGDRGAPSHLHLVRLLEGALDVGVRTAALQLINQLILASGEHGASRAKLLHLLHERLRLGDVLSSQLHVADAAFAEQLSVYEQLTRRNVPRSWSEAKTLRHRTASLTAQLGETRCVIEAMWGSDARAASLHLEWTRLQDACRDALASGTDERAMNGTRERPSNGGGDEGGGDSIDNAGLLARFRRLASQSGDPAHNDSGVTSPADTERVAMWRSARDAVLELHAELSLLLESQRQAQRTLEQAQLVLDLPIGGAVTPVNALSRRAASCTPAQPPSQPPDAAGASSAAATLLPPPLSPPPPPLPSLAPPPLAPPGSAVQVAAPPLAPPPLTQPPLALPASAPPGAMPPPPIAAGLAPPPPPPPGGTAGAPRPPPVTGTGVQGALAGVRQPTRQPAKPSVRMKPLHWKRVLLHPPPPLSSVAAAGAGAEPGAAASRPTVWQLVPEMPFDVRALEAAFGSATSGGGSQADGSRPSKPAVTKALDPKRSNAVAIMMSSLPPIHEVKAAIGALNERVLSREQLEKVRTHLPTAEEAELIASLDGPGVKWDKPEMFLCALMAIPRLRMRLRCWSIKYGFSEHLAELEELAQSIATAIAAVRASEGLPAVLGVVLALGNHLNGGTPKGQSDGFTLADLGKLSVTKDNTNSFSLLEYAMSLPVAAVGLRLADELASVREAKAKLSDVHAGLQRLRADARELMQASRPADGDGETLGPADVAGGVDPFTRTMGRFAEQAQQHVERIGAQVDEVDREYRLLLSWLRVKSPPKVKYALESDELFAVLLEFADAVKTAAPKRPQPSLRRHPAEATFSTKLPMAPTAAAIALQDSRRASSAVPVDPMLSQFQCGSSRVATEPHNGLSSTIAAPARGERTRAVDKRLQERLQSRFERAQSRSAGLQQPH